jgi:dolichol-phosphate mannosyltransferase
MIEGEGVRSGVAILIAAMNEEKGIGPTIQEIHRYVRDAHILVVDGRSSDRTVEIAKDLGAAILVQERKGKGDAVNQGIKKLGADFEHLVLIDADFTYPAQSIPKMIEIMKRNKDVGMVVGNRFNPNAKFRHASNDLFYLGNRMLAFAQHMVNGVRLEDPLSGLRIVRNELAQRWNLKSQGFDVEVEMNYAVENGGYRIVEIPIAYRSRLGEKKLKFHHGLVILRRMFAEGLS